MLTWTPTTKDYYNKLNRLRQSPDFKKDENEVTSRVVSDPTVVAEYSLDDFNLHFMQDNGGPFAPDSEIMKRFKGTKPDSEAAQFCYDWRNQMGSKGVDISDGVSVSKIYTTKNEIPISVYTPELKNPNEKLGAFIAYHGGGWIGGNVLVNENFCKYIAQKARLRVFNVDYRFAPEYSGYTLTDDCYEALNYIVENSSKLNVDTSKVVVYGDSAGGTLAAAVAYMDQKSGNKYVTHQVMCYPCVTLDKTTSEELSWSESKYHLDSVMKTRYQNDNVFSAKGMPAIVDVYINGGDTKDPRFSPYNMDDEDYQNMPQAFIATDEFDPLRPSGYAYAKRLTDNGVAAYYSNYRGMTHAFLDKFGIFPQGQEFADQVAKWLNR